MTAIRDLTVEDFIGVLDGYYAKPEKRQNMTMEEIKDLAERINERINIPLVRETREEKILVKVILKVDTFLYNHLPNEIYDLVRSIDRGIDDDEAKRLIKSLAQLANRKINIPYLPEGVEYKIFRFIIAIVINGARRLLNFTEAKNQIDIDTISDQKDFADDEFENLMVPVVAA